MNEWYSGIYKAFILASAVSFFISFFTTGTNSYGSILTGYSTLILGIIMILILLFNNIFRVSQNTTQTLSALLMTTGPFLLILGVIGFILYLVITYKNIIVEGHVATSYYTFTKISVILIKKYKLSNISNTEKPLL
jgi:glucan phosphoethanolaminetransferase (alkaline phosphatase superfamily)